MGSKLNESAVKELVELWYQKLNVHAPLVEFLPLLAEEGLEMKFPEATLHGLAEFEGWHRKVNSTFFDVNHPLKDVKVKIEGDTAKVHIVLEWHASFWNPPEAKSKRITADADQDWMVKISPRTGKPMVVKYIVNSMTYHKGSATL